MKIKKCITLAFVLTSLVCLLFSCKGHVGLGETVDTSAPEVSITYPPLASVIRGEFILAGTWNDDKTVKSVSVSVIDTVTKETIDTIPGTVNPDKTWSAVIGTKKDDGSWPYLDGTYQLTVEVMDGAKHPAYDSRSFDIDNTAPFFVISKPGVTKAKTDNKTKFSPYGSVFTVEGTISEDHAVDSMDVNIYGDEGGSAGTLLGSFHGEDIATAGGSSVTVAQVNAADGLYETIHPAQTGTEKYYCTVKLTDSAREYVTPDEKENTSCGNETTKLYLYDDIYTKLVSAKKGLGLSYSTLKSIKNGTLVNPEVLEELNKKEIDSASADSNYLSFSLNPEANPTYIVSGYSYNAASDLKEAANGNGLNVTIKSGLDDTLIDPDCVKVWLKEFDGTEPPAKADVISQMDSLSEEVRKRELAEYAFVQGAVDFSSATDIDGWKLIYDYDQKNSEDASSTSTETFSATIPDFAVVMNKFYMVCVTGNDIDDVPFLQDCAFGFIGNEPGIAPTLSVTSPVNLSVKKGSDETNLAFTGTATVNSSSLYVKEMKATLVVKDEDNSNAIVGQASYKADIAKLSKDDPFDVNPAFTIDNDGNWTFIPAKLSDYQEFSAAENSEKAYLYTVTIEAYSSSGHSANQVVSVHVDTKKPVVSITSITPYVNGEDFDGIIRNNYLNGDITVKANVEESNLTDVLLKVYVDGGAVPVISRNLERTFSIKEVIDTTALAASGKVPVKIEVVAVDACGNEGKADSTTLFTVKENDADVYQDVFICQETDRPQIKLNNAALSYKVKENGVDVIKSLAAGKTDSANKANINLQNNLFGVTSNNILQGTVTDDDGLQAIRITVYKEDLDSDSNFVEVDRDTHYVEGKTSYSFKKVLPSDEGKYRVRIDAYDYLVDFSDEENPNGANSTGEFWIAVDSGAPSIEINSPVAGSYQSGTIDVAGNVTKYVGVAVSGKLYSVDGSGNLTEVTVNGAQVGPVTISSEKENSVYNWTGTAKLPSDASGTYRLIYTASDSYGQSATKDKTFVVDITPPVFTTDEAGNIYTREESYTVKGTIDDTTDTSGIKAIYFSVVKPVKNEDGSYKTIEESKPAVANGIYDLFNEDKTLKTGWEQGGVVAIVTKDASGNNTSKGKYKWTCDVGLPTGEDQDGTVPTYIYFAVEDEAGNVSLLSDAENSNSITAFRDAKDPSTTLLGTGLRQPAPDGSISTPLAAASALAEGDVYYSNNPAGFTLSGKVTEESNSYTVKINGVTVDHNPDGSWSYLVTPAGDSSSAYRIEVEDGAKNKIEKVVTVTYDTTVPVLTVNADAARTGAKFIYEGNANYSVSNGISRYMISGKWKDDTSGTAKIEYRVKTPGAAAFGAWKEISDVTKSTAESSWTDYIEITEGAGQAIEIRATDAAGNETVPADGTTSYSGLTIDAGAPKIEITSEKQVYVKAGQTLLIEGTFSDTNAIASFTAVAKLDGTVVPSGSKGYTFTTIPADVSGVKNGTFVIQVTPDETSAHSSDGLWTFGLEAVDAAGRKCDETGAELKTAVVTPAESRTETALSLKTTVDTVAPKWLSDETYKTTVAGKEWSDSKNWYNSSSLKFIGYYTESGSGIKDIEWSVTPAGSQTPVTGIFSAEDKGSYEKFEATLDGFVASSTANIVRLKAVDEAGNESLVQTYDIYIDEESPDFDSDISGTKLSNKVSDIVVTGTVTDDASGVSSVVLKVNNVSVDAVIDTTSDGLSAVNAKWTAVIPAKTILKNLEDKNYPVKATVTDDAGNNTSSTIFKIAVDATAPVAQISGPSNVNAINGKKEISGKSIDKNEFTEFALYYRTDTPDDSPSDLRGWTAVPWNKFNSTPITVLALDTEYGTDGDKVKSSDMANWFYKDEYEFDFSALVPLDAETVTVYLLPVVVDEATNCNVYSSALDGNGDVVKTYNLKNSDGTKKYTKYDVDLNTDRPVVKITNLIENGTDADGNDLYTLKYGTRARILGSVTDDDSTGVKVLEALIGASKQIKAAVKKDASTYTVTFADNSSADFTYTQDSTKGTWYNADHGTTIFTFGNGGFIYEPRDIEDGPKTVYFYAKDNAGGIFTIGAADKINAPYIQYSDTTPAEEPSLVKYNSDSKSPEIVSGQALPYKADGTVNGAGDDKDQYATISSDYLAGGINKQKLKIKILAKDASGIVGMAMEIAYTDLSGNEATIQKATAAVLGEESYAGYTIDNTNFTDSSDISSDAEWIVEIPDLHIMATCTPSIKVEAFDGAGLKGNGSYSFAVDNSGPVITISSPVKNSEVTGSISLAGITTESGGSRVESTKFYVPTKAEMTAFENAADSVKANYWNSSAFDSKFGGIFAQDKDASNWQFDLDGIEGSNPKLDSFSNSTYDDNPESGIYKLPVIIRSTDTLGNVTVKTDFVLRNNPDGDRPRTTVTYPTEKNYDDYVYNSETDTYTSLGYATIGGTIRATGSVEIPSLTSTVHSVYLQLDADNGTYNAAAKAKAQAYADKKGAKIYTVVDAYSIINSILNTDYSSSTEFPTSAYETEQKFLDAVGFATRTDLNNWWGIKTHSTMAAWNISLNESGELNPQSGTNNIQFRACGVNADSKFGGWTSSYKLHIDDQAPVLSYSLQQITVEAPVTAAKLRAATPDATQPYTADMYLKGAWYIVVKAMDESGIDSVYTATMDKADKTASIFVSPIEKINDPADSDNGKEGNFYYIPVTGSEGAHVFEIEVKDKDQNGARPSRATLNFNLDNTAPVLKTVIGNGIDDLLPETPFTAAAPYAIEESDNTYTLSGTSEDRGSGMERMIFYFIRQSASMAEKVVMDPVMVNGTDVIASGDDEGKIDSNSADTNVKVLLSELDELTVTQGAASYKLYGKTIAGSLASTQQFIPDDADSIIDNKHIRAGGIVFLEGVYRKITKIDSTTGEIDFEPSTASTVLSSGSAVFPYAQVVDSTNGETAKNTTDKNFGGIDNDDGDGIVDKINKISGAWSAILHSTNLPDGPCDLVILAFDAAGNVSGTTIPSVIQNNAPRLAKLWLGTDLNSSNSFTQEEFVEYALLNEGAAKGKESASVDLLNAYTAKDKLVVSAEITGGNGAVKMAFKRGSADISSAITSAQATGTLEETAVAGVAFNKFFTAAGASAVRSYVLDNKALTGIETLTAQNNGNGTGKKLAMTFWDSTEETVSGTSSQKASLALDNMKFDLFDGTKPLVVINPFYWKDLNNNSIYNSAKVSKPVDLAGHIELEDDIKNIAQIVTTMALGTDPKVSGKIVLTGTAYDEHALGKLVVSFGNATASAFVSQDAAVYDKTTGKWAVAEKAIDTDGWEFTVSDETTTYSYDAKNSVQKETTPQVKPASYGYFEDTVYMSQTGHKVYWTLSIDTSTLDKVAAKDVFATVTAVDLSAQENATSTDGADVKAPVVTENDGVKTRTVTDGTTNYPVYQMDVVPYIIELSTTLSEIEKKNHSVYGRSAAGRYPVYFYIKNAASGSAEGEPVGMKGFNLKSGATVKMVNAASGTTLDSSLNFTIPAAAKSGAISVVVEGVESLNNVHSYSAKGDFVDDESASSKFENYKNYYNRQPNNANNDYLTDKVELAVWGIDSQSAYSPEGTLSEPTMHVNPSSGQLGFSFASGNSGYYPYGTKADGTAQSSSSQFWCKDYTPVNTVRFVYDAQGHMFGVHAGTDTNNPRTARFRLNSSVWGVNTESWQTWDSDWICAYSAHNALRLEYMGYYNAANQTYAMAGNRFLFHPQLATSIHASATTKTNVYLMYYESLTNELRFRAGSMSNTTAFTNDEDNLWKKSVMSFDDFSDDAIEYGSDSTKTVTNYDHVSVIASSSTAYKPGQRYAIAVVSDVIASKTVSSAVSSTISSMNGSNAYCDNSNTVQNQAVYILDANKTVIGEGTLGARQGGMGNRYFDLSGITYTGTPKYFSLKASATFDTADTDVVVAVWHDPINNKLWYSYLENPIANNHQNVDATTHVNTSWSTPVPVLDGVSGGHCAIAVDPDKHIHIAAFTKENTGSLSYTYLDSYNSALDAANPEKNTVLVDSYGATGQYITIDFAKDDTGTRYIPYIGYLMTSIQYPKYAYLADIESSGANGTTWAPKAGTDADNMYTGAWESITLPTKNEFILDDICIGVYRNATTGKPAAVTGCANAASPVLGYGINYAGSGYMETAQLK